MDLTLPSGVRLGDATRDDCLKAGGFYAVIAKKIKPGHTVSQDFSEADLQKLYAAGPRV